MVWGPPRGFPSVVPSNERPPALQWVNTGLPSPQERRKAYEKNRPTLTSLSANRRPGRALGQDIDPDIYHQRQDEENRITCRVVWQVQLKYKRSLTFDSFDFQPSKLFKENFIFQPSKLKLVLNLLKLTKSVKQLKRPNIQRLLAVALWRGSLLQRPLLLFHHDSWSPWWCLLRWRTHLWVRSTWMDWGKGCSHRNAPIWNQCSIK